MICPECEQATMIESQHTELETIGILVFTTKVTTEECPLCGTFAKLVRPPVCIRELPA